MRWVLVVLAVVTLALLGLAPLWFKSTLPDALAMLAGLWLALNLILAMLSGLVCLLLRFFAPRPGQRRAAMAFGWMGIYTLGSGFAPVFGILLAAVADALRQCP